MQLILQNRWELQLEVWLFKQIVKEVEKLTLWKGKIWRKNEIDSIYTLQTDHSVF